MSGSLSLDWATLAVSMFNAILLLWLGLTVLLNAEPHTWGIWLAGGGLLSGAAFFFIHSVILGLGFAYVYSPSDFWWHSGWIPVILAPFAWYVVMLWYTGFWEGRTNPIHRRHKPWLVLLLMTTLLMVGLFLFASPLPSFGDLVHLKLAASPEVFGAPVLILLYPPFILACIGLSLDALLRPGPTIRMMGQLARQRARPWLAAASGVLLLVTLLVAGFMGWLVLHSRAYTPSLSLAWGVGWLDLVISSLIAVSILLTGQAIVTYEVFTGKALPRRGLRRQWYWALALAGGYSFFLALAVTLRLPVIYSLAGSAGLLVLSLALVSRRTFRDRDDFIAALRPFFASQQLYDQILTAPDGQGVREAEMPFQALCGQVLGARSASLTPTGPLASLFGPPLHFPNQTTAPALGLIDLPGEINQQTLYVAFEKNSTGQGGWVIPLWNPRGLCGYLMLGEKQDGGLYSEEEMEIARSAGERLMDLQTSAEIARRLMALQRRQLAESQVLDRQARRALHDEVLPRLHAVLLELSSVSQQAKPPALLDTLSEVHRMISGLLHDLPASNAPQVLRYGLPQALRQAVEDEFRGAFDQVSWMIDPETEHKLADVPDLETEVLFHAAREAIRNAAHHARPADDKAVLSLSVSIEWNDGVEINVQDNGMGIDNLNGRNSSGSGLELHRTLLAVIGGSLLVKSELDRFTLVKILLPQPD
jgi:signal transduction histidine kinase